MSPEDRESCIIFKHLYDHGKKNLGITQERLSDLTGIKQQMISRHLNCKQAMSAETVIKYAKAYDVSPGFIDARLVYLDTESNLVEDSDPIWVPILDNEAALNWRFGRINYDRLASDIQKYYVGRMAHHLCWAMRLTAANLSPRLLPGDILLCNPSVPPELNRLAVYLVEGDLVVGYMSHLGSKPFLNVPGYPAVDIEADGNEFVATVTEVKILAPRKTFA